MILHHDRAGPYKKVFRYPKIEALETVLRESDAGNHFLTFTSENGRANVLQMEYFRASSLK